MKPLSVSLFSSGYGLNSKAWHTKRLMPARYSCVRCWIVSACFLVSFPPSSSSGRPVYLQLSNEANNLILLQMQLLLPNVPLSRSSKSFFKMHVRHPAVISSAQWYHHCAFSPPSQLGHGTLLRVLNAPFSWLSRFFGLKNLKSQTLPGGSGFGTEKSAQIR